MAIPALLGGLARGMAGGARGLARAGVRSGVTSAIKGKTDSDKGGAIKPYGAIVPVNKGNALVKTQTDGGSAGGGGSGGGSALSTVIAPKSQAQTSLVKPASGGSSIDILRDIKSRMDQIYEVEVREIKTEKQNVQQEKKTIDTERKLLEQEKRTAEQEQQEAGKEKSKSGRRRSNPIVNAAKKTVGGIWDFLTGILGEFIKYKVLDWISKPENREKIKKVVQFVQKVPEYFMLLKEKIIDPWFGFFKEFIGGGWKLFNKFLTVFIDILTLKFFSDPKQFLDHLLEIPKTIIEIIPGIINSLINAVTLGTVKNINDLLGKLFKDPLSGIGNALSNLTKGGFGGFMKGAGDFFSGVGNAIVGGAKVVGGAVVDAITPPAAAGTLDSAPNMPSTGAGQDVRFGAVSGHSGSVAYGGKEKSALSVNYSPFAASDVQKQGISIISGKGYRSSTNSNHKGYDFPAVKGTPLYAYLPGKVLASKYFSGYGNGIEWQDSIYKQKHFFAHMMSPSPLKVGDTFQQGALLGKTGDTGTPGSYHLHWEIGGRGSEVDPGQWVNSHPLPTGNADATAIATVTTPQIPSTTGQALVETQQENLQLSSTPTSETSSGNNVATAVTSSTNLDSGFSSSSLGGTLPSSGVWATFKTNL